MNPQITNTTRQPIHALFPASRNALAAVILATTVSMPALAGEWEFTGHVGVESPDHVVPVLEGVGSIVVKLMSTRLGVPHQVQPMPAPPFAKVRRLQELIDDIFEGLIRRILIKPLHLLGRRR